MRERERSGEREREIQEEREREIVGRRDCRERVKQKGKKGGSCPPLTAHGQARGLAVASPGPAPAALRWPPARGGRAGHPKGGGRENSRGAAAPPAHA